jgi:DNA-binding NtrC family response regulator
MDTEDDRTSLFERHPWLAEIRPLIESVANINTSVLLHGESRRMCRIVAKAIHASSAGRCGFIEFNCERSGPETFEVELFGIERVRPTGEVARKLGLIEIRESTLYLKDIAAMPLDLQAKLLRALRDGRVLRQGGRAPIDVDVHLIAATDRDLGIAVARGEFLEELYRLLKVAEIRVPPLTREERERAEAEEVERIRLDLEWLEPIEIHNDACRAFARTGAGEGLICPHCRHRSREGVEFVDYSGQHRKSFFVCRACGRSFGHEL